MSTKKNTLYVTFRKEEDKFVGHSISSEPPTVEYLEEWRRDGGIKEKINGSKGENLTGELSSFEDVLNDFKSMMSTYRNMIPMTISVSPMIAGAMANRKLGDFIKARGVEKAELSSEEFSVFEIDDRHYSTIVRKHEETIAAVQGASHLSEIAVIGLISVYDAYLAKLLRLIFRLHQKLVFNSERDIKLSELLRLGTIEDAKTHIVDKEVESVLRNSHHEQFSWMEKKFDITLTKGLKVWPEFIELCERRNLLTHTGGYVSAQYLKVCSDHGQNSENKVGEKLKTDAKYFAHAVSIIAEIGIKLGHVLWRKLNPEERERADSNLNETGLHLIQIRQYKLAQKVLDLGVNTIKKHHSDYYRRMMIVNLANAHRLDKDMAAATSILNREDWSATGPDFQICVSAVREDIEAVTKYMKTVGNSGNVGKDEYREWPVFRKVRENEKFKVTFEDVFGEPLFADTQKVEMSVNDETKKENADDDGETAHSIEKSVH